MNTRTLSTAFVIAALTVVGFAGCYTKLMPFREAVATRKQSMAAEHKQNGPGTTSGSDLNYSNDCLTCHSEAELNDRAFDMDRAGLISVHGGAYDPYGWQNPYTQPPWWDPYPPVYIVPGGPGQLPVITTGGGSAANDATKSNSKRPRTNSGSERESATRPRTPGGTTTTTASPTPTASTPTTSTPPAGSSAGPVISTPPPTQSTPPASPPAETRGRSSSGSEETRSRKSGSGRE